jgi:predicted ATP-dependent endonuclease of OLD family
VRIVRVHIENFRGIKLADIHFERTTVLLGDNNTGKSTVLEAIELAIGADRLARTQVIDEHDFYGGNYRGVETSLRRPSSREPTNDICNREGRTPSDRRVSTSMWLLHERGAR